MHVTCVLFNSNPLFRRGPISKIASMIPGLPQDLMAGGDEETAMRMKRMIYITDSMTASELDSDGSMFMKIGKDGKPIKLTSRVLRVAKGSGTSVREVEELLCQYRMMASMAKQAGGKKGWSAKFTSTRKNV
jgi:signal recognition particle subunit SRP54